MIACDNPKSSWLVCKLTTTLGEVVAFGTIKSLSV